MKNLKIFPIEFLEDCSKIFFYFSNSFTMREIEFSFLTIGWGDLCMTSGYRQFICFILLGTIRKASRLFEMFFKVMWNLNKLHLKAQLTRFLSENKKNFHTRF